MRRITPPSFVKDVIDIQTAGRNLLATVSNILDFSELETGKLTLAEETAPRRPLPGFFWS